MNEQKILELKSVSYRYKKSSKNVLSNLNMSFQSGKMYGIIGKSGAGKTTLLSLLSGLTKPTDGKILFNGKDIAKINKYEYRSQMVGVIFQNFNLLPYLSAAENVMLSMDISGKKISDKKKRAYEILDSMGLNNDEADRRILKLSGGQQQRVAIARALSFDPQIIFADEPTGNLDGETQNEIITILRSLKEKGKCVIVVTHSPDVSKSCDEIYSL